MNLAVAYKKKRLAIFFDSFMEVISNVHEGHLYSVGMAKSSAYWEYLKGYHTSWQTDPLGRKAERQMRLKFWNGIELYYDIKKNGMLNPLEMRKRKGRIHLWAGYRRLVILKVLGIKTAKVSVPAGDE